MPINKTSVVVAKKSSSVSKKRVEVKDARINRILISQPKPESEKSPYFDLERKHGVQLHFTPFIQLEPIVAKDFRKQKVDIASHSSIIFTSKNAIEHFFRLAEESKININQDNKYFCITEAVALFLQKFILYRKRKVFYGADGTNKSMFEVINKHKEAEKFLYVCSENQQDNEIVNYLKSNNCEYSLGYMYRTVSSKINETITTLNDFDIVCLFTPSGVKSLIDNYPNVAKENVLIGSFGVNTAKAIEEAGLVSTIKAPIPMSPSMITALDKYLAETNK